MIADAGLPVPKGVALIDLALTQGVPDLATTLRIVLSEMQVESHILANELAPAPRALCSLSLRLTPSLGYWGPGGCWPTMHSKRCALSAKAIVHGECHLYKMSHLRFNAMRFAHRVSSAA